MSFRSDGTRLGAWDGVFPSSRSQSGMRAGDDDRRDDRATARGRALGMESSPPLAPSQGCEQETTTAETTERRHEAGHWGLSLPLLSLPVRDASRRQRPQRRRSDGTRPGAGDGVFPPPLAPSQGCKQGTTMAVPRGYEQDEKIRSVLGRADPEQGPP